MSQLQPCPRGRLGKTTACSSRHLPPHPRGQAKAGGVSQRMEREVGRWVQRRGWQTEPTSNKDKLRQVLDADCEAIELKDR